MNTATIIDTVATSTTYAQLRNGAWGIRTKGYVPTAGDIVNVAKRDGSTSVAYVTQVVWQGQDSATGQPAALCAIASTQRRQGAGKPAPRPAAQPNASTPAAVPSRRASGFRGARKPRKVAPSPSIVDADGETIADESTPTFVF